MHGSLRTLPLLFAFSALACTSSILGPDTSPPAATLHSSRLATVLDSLRYGLDLPALAGAMVTGDSTVDAQAVGCRRYGGVVNVTVNDQFHLGSCGKSFAAALMGMLVDDGKVGWTTTLPEVFPELAASMRDEYKQVTVIDILSHGSGMRRDPDKIPLPDGPTRDQRLAVVAWALQQPPAVPRGTFLYSNLAFIIAGAVIERRTGEAYEDLLVRRLLTPLGITSATWLPPGTPGREDQPLQHTFANAPIEPLPSSDLLPIYSPAGLLHLSIGDWGRYARWIIAGERGNITLLQPATFRTLTSGRTPTGDGSFYALGWGTGSGPMGKILSHAGSNGFNYSIIWLAPERNFGIVIATNKGGGDTDTRMGQVLNRLAAEFLPPR